MGTPEEQDIHQTRAWELLETDPLEVAERLTGKPYTDPPTGVIGLSVVSELADRKRMLLSEQNDTYSDMPWRSFIGVLEQTGLIRFQDGKRAVRSGSTSDWIAAADPDRKLLLTADSYNGRLNRADVYGMVDPGPDKAAGKAAALLLHRLQTSSGPIGETGFHFTIDGREGLRMKLAELAAADIPPIDWQQSEQLRMRKESNDLLLPDWVQRFTGPLSEAK